MNSSSKIISVTLLYKNYIAFIMTKSNCWNDIQCLVKCERFKFFHHHIYSGLHGLYSAVSRGHFQT